MRLSELTEESLTGELIDRLLFEGLEYRGQKGGIVMVLGSRKACEYRVPYAAEIFRSCGAKRLLFCGGKVQRTAFGEKAEYESMLMAAQRLGIGRELILTETRSMTTEENFALSQPILAQELENGGRIILVTTAYHMRRALMLAQRILPQYELIPAPADKGSTRRSNWRLSEKGRRTARAECMKLRYYAETGRIENIDI